METTSRLRDEFEFEMGRGRRPHAHDMISSIEEAEKQARAEFAVKSVNYGDNKEFDTFDPTFEESKSSKSKSIRTSESIADDLKLAMSSIEFYCWRCSKWINQNCYKKHYTSHIFEKDFLITRWKRGRSFKQVEALQEQIQTNFRKNKTIEAYKDKILSPSRTEDFLIIFHLLKDISASKSKLEETIKLLPTLLTGIPDDEGKTILFDQMPLRKYKPIDSGYEES